jgi:ubiquinone biosynthesis protein
VYLPLLAVGAVLIIGPVFAFGMRRLMGVRLPVLRTLVAGVIAVLLFSPIVTAMIGGPTFPKKPGVLPVLWFVILGVVIALLAGMVFLVIAEALVPSGSVPGPVYLLRGMRRGMGRAGRYWQISRILARRGLLPYARGGVGPSWPRRTAGPR